MLLEAIGAAIQGGPEAGRKPFELSKRGGGGDAGACTAAVQLARLREVKGAARDQMFHVSCRHSTCKSHGRFKESFLHAAVAKSEFCCVFYTRNAHDVKIVDYWAEYGEAMLYTQKMIFLVVAKSSSNTPVMQETKRARIK